MAYPPYRLIGIEELGTVLSLVIRHSLRHETDPGDLAIAIEFLKAIRDEGPERIAHLNATWAEEIAEAKI